MINDSENKIGPRKFRPCKIKFDLSKTKTKPINMTIQERAREFINSDELKEGLDAVQRMWLEAHIVDLLDEFQQSITQNSENE